MDQINNRFLVIEKKISELEKENAFLKAKVKYLYDKADSATKPAITKEYNVNKA